MKNLLFLLTISLLLISSCRTTKKIVDEPISEEAPSDLVLAYQQNKLQFDQLEMMTNVSYESDMSLSFNGIFRIKNGEMIWGSFKKFGFEAARLLITTDSVFVLNRMQKQYIAEDISNLENMTGVPLVFDDLQQLLVGGSFWTNGLKEVTDSTLMKTKVINSDLVTAIHTFDANNKVKRSDLTSEKNGELHIDYSTFQDVNSYSLALFRSFSVIRTKMNVLLDIETVQIDLESTKTFPFEIPPNYTRQSF